MVCAYQRATWHLTTLCPFVLSHIFSSTNINGYVAMTIPDMCFHILCMFIIARFFRCFQLCPPGYTAALTPVSAPLLWANARQGAAGGGVADLEVDRVGAAEPCMVQRSPEGTFFYRSTNSFTVFCLIVRSDSQILLGSLEQRMSFEQHSKEASGFRCSDLLLSSCLRQPMSCTCSMHSILAVRSRTDMVRKSFRMFKSSGDPRRRPSSKPLWEDCRITVYNIL